MKMITAIVNKEDSNAVCHVLTKDGFSVTRLPTTGGFLMAGNMTLLIGTEDEKVDRCIELIASQSKQRTEIVPSTASYGIGVTTAYPLEVTVGGATIFVTNVERFEKV
ncbi:MAG: cyclic-di-AMP receptor [Ruthenibacterium sp.]